jgi:integrating conjugative element protein (TIGR03758 family)
MKTGSHWSKPLRLERPRSLALFVLLSLWWTLVVAKQLGPRVIVTADQVAAAVAGSPLSDSLKKYATDIGRLGVFESGGNLSVYNGTCCTGVLQVNRGGLKRYCKCSPAEYASMPLSRQIEVWAKVTNGNANTRTVRNLMARGTFDGKPVDGAMVLACIQLGPGYCAKTLAAGTCSTRAGADINGTNFCTMAARIRGADSVLADPGAGTSPGSDAGSTADAGGASGTYWNPVSAEDAFFNGAGVDMSEVNTFVSNLVAGATLLWAAWVSQAQYFLWRRRSIGLMDLQSNILRAAVVASLVLVFILA